MSWETLKPYLAALARHGGTYLAGIVAGAVVAMGARLSADQTTQLSGILTSILMAAAAYGWSAWQKRQQAQAVVKARAQRLDGPSPLDPAPSTLQPGNHP